LLNYTDTDPQTNKPFTEKAFAIVICAQPNASNGADGLMSRALCATGRCFALGMATETYPQKRLPAGALVRFQPNGRITVASGTHELGTGMYTTWRKSPQTRWRYRRILSMPSSAILFYHSADLRGLNERSQWWTPAVQLAAAKARLNLFSMAIEDARSPVHGARADDLDFKKERFFEQSPAVAEHYSTILTRMAIGRLSDCPHHAQRER